MNRNKEIDYLRAYAVSLVCILHVFGTIYVTMNGTEWPWVHYGFDVGVDIFFVISGYVISASYASLRKRFSGVELYREFMVRRFVRLWPAAMFWLLVCFAGSVITQSVGYFPSPKETLYKALSGSIYLYNFAEFRSPSVLGYFWSLSVEWQFYMLLPVLLVVPFVARIGVLLTLLILLIFWHPGGDGWWMFRFDGILIGIAIWEFRERGVLQFFMPRQIPLLMQSAITAFLLMQILFVSQYISVGYLGLFVQCLLSGILVAFATESRGLVSCFSMGTVITWIGLRSYSIYLCHIPITLFVVSAWKAYDLPINWWHASVITLVLVAASSEFSYRVLEGIKLPAKKHAIVAAE